jgi:hypothetical protein
MKLGGTLPGLPLLDLSTDHVDLNAFIELAWSLSLTNPGSPRLSA